MDAYVSDLSHFSLDEHVEAVIAEAMAAARAEALEEAAALAERIGMSNLPKRIRALAKPGKEGT